MFSEAQKSAYRAVAAPDALRERVLEMAAEMPLQKKRPVRRFVTMAAAACLALVLLATTLMPQHGPEFLVDGAAVGELAIAVPGENGGVALARNAPALSVPVTIRTHVKTTLAPSCGMLRNGDAVTEVCEIDSPAELVWEIDAVDMAESYELSAVCGEQISVLTLAFDAEGNCWTVSAAEE